MNAQPSTLRIESIIFDNTDTKVLIKGETVKNHLSYPSEMFISFNDLNIVLNYLQQQNPGVNVLELFEEENFGGGYLQTVLDAQLLENKAMDLSFFSFGKGKKLIRA